MIALSRKSRGLAEEKEGVEEDKMVYRCSVLGSSRTDRIRRINIVDTTYLQPTEQKNDS